MKSAIFKLKSNVNDTEENALLLQQAEELIRAKDDQGNLIEGCSWSLPGRIDEDYIQVGIRTTDEVMDMVMADPRLELLQKLEGWPDEIENADMDNLADIHSDT